MERQGLCFKDEMHQSSREGAEGLELAVWQGLAVKILVRGAKERGCLLVLAVKLVLFSVKGRAWSPIVVPGEMTMFP